MAVQYGRRYLRCVHPTRSVSLPIFWGCSPKKKWQYLFKEKLFFEFSVSHSIETSCRLSVISDQNLIDVFRYCRARGLLILGKHSIIHIIWVQYTTWTFIKNWNPDLPRIQEFKSGLASQLIRSCLCIFLISRFYLKIWLQSFFCGPVSPRNSKIKCCYCFKNKNI